MKKVFIDVETTGLSYQKHSVIQVAGIIMDGNKFLQDFNYTMQPDWNKQIDPRALQVNGRTTDELKGFDGPRKAWGEVKEDLSQYIDPYDTQDKAFFIAYNSQFDYGFVRSAWRQYVGSYFNSFFWTTHICAKHLAAYYLQNKRSQMVDFKLSTVCKTLGINLENAHDAMADCIALREVYESVTKNAPVLK